MNCEGCQYEDFGGGEWPCCDCSRFEREDMYEPIEDDDIAQTAVEAFQSMIDNGDINIEFSEDESEDEEEVSTASVGGNSIDLGDVVVHLDDYKQTEHYIYSVQAEGHLLGVPFSDNICTLETFRSEDTGST